MANPVWVSSSTPNHTTANVSAVGNVPASVAAGDLLVAQVVAVSAAGGVVTAHPSGYTEIRTDSIGSVPGRRSTLAWKLATASEGSTHTWTITSAVDATVTITRITGAHSTAPVDDHSGTTITATTIVSTAVSPTSAEALLLLLLVHATTGVSYNAVSGMTERYDVNTTSRTVALDTEALAASGSTGTRSATATANNAQIAQMVAIKPPAAATRIAPDAILSQTNLTGVVASIQDDPDSADANWLTAP